MNSQAIDPAIEAAPAPGAVAADSVRAGSPILTFLVRALLGLGLVGFLLWRQGMRPLTEALTRESLSYFAAAVVLYIGGQVLSAYRWEILARRLDLNLTFSEYVSFCFIGMFTNLFVPAPVGGDTARALYLGRRSGHYGKAAATVVADRVVGLAALTWLAAACAWALGEGRLPHALIFPMILAGLATLVGYLLMPFLVPAIDFLPKRIASSARILVPYFSRPVALIPALLLSLALQVLLVFMQYVLALGLGLKVSILTFLLCVPPANIVASIPITLNGLGLRETAYLVLLGVAGVSKPDAVALGLLWFGSTTVAGLFGGLSFMLTSTRKHEDQPDSKVCGPQDEQTAFGLN